MNDRPRREPGGAAPRIGRPASWWFPARCAAAILVACGATIAATAAFAGANGATATADAPAAAATPGTPGTPAAPAAPATVSPPADPPRPIDRPVATPGERLQAGIAPGPSSRQHLLRPGQDIGAALESAAPGDEVILWPGRYAGASLRGIAGRPDAPITLRGLRTDDPPVIEGGAWGLRLLGVAHLRISDLIIAGSRVDGIEIGPGETGATSRSVRIERVRIRDVGERPGRHGIAILGAEDVLLRDLTIEGWTGSGIEVVGGRRVTIDTAQLTGTGRGELLGIRLRAGTSLTTIRQVRLVEPGIGAIALGGRSRDSDFPSHAAADRDGRRWEVSGSTIEDVTILGSQIPLTFLGVTQTSIMHVTVVDPQRSAIRIARPREDEAFGTLGATSIARCLFVWRADEQPVLAEFGPGADASGLWLEENLWWRAPSPFTEDAAFPGNESFPQLVGVDPALGEDLRPRAAAAADYGDRSPPASPTVPPPGLPPGAAADADADRSGRPPEGS